MINFTRAFDTAWERTMIILFRPFDFGKWCAIGLSAFLAGFLEGGNGFNGYNNNFNPKNTNFQTSFTSNYDSGINQFSTTMNQALSGMETGLLVLVAVVVGVFVLAFVVLLYWLGARGQFHAAR